MQKLRVYCFKKKFLSFQDKLSTRNVYTSGAGCSLMADRTAVAKGLIVQEFFIRKEVEKWSFFLLYNKTFGKIF